MGNRDRVALLCLPDIVQPHDQRSVGRSRPTNTQKSLLEFARVGRRFELSSPVSLRPRFVAPQLRSYVKGSQGAMA
jgi:hypothetical protein